MAPTTLHGAPRRARGTALMLVAAAVAGPATAQVTSGATALLPPQISITVGSNSYHGTLPAGPMPSGYSLTVPPSQPLPPSVSARLIRRGPLEWRLSEASAAGVLNQSATVSTGPHRTELVFLGGASPVAGTFELSLLLSLVGASTHTAQVTIDGVPVTLDPSGPATLVPYRIEAGQRVRVVAETATSTWQPTLGFLAWSTVELDIGFRVAPSPSIVTELGPGCGPTGFDAFGEPSNPTLQVLRVRDLTAGPLVAAIAVGTAPGAFPLGLHAVTGQPCTLWTFPVDVAFVPLDAARTAEIRFDASVASGADLVLQAATMDPGAVLSLSRGLRILCP
ncbi:MAG: hypothetical protein IPM29_30725 [Planctomycetes bacterium]|nr:hypothetical protein [Planctomycetota bacterium]